MYYTFRHLHGNFDVVGQQTSDGRRWCLRRGMRGGLVGAKVSAQVLLLDPTGTASVATLGAFTLVGTVGGALGFNVFDIHKKKSD